jgi:hypothetical protein
MVCTGQSGPDDIEPSESTFCDPASNFASHLETASWICLELLAKGISDSFQRNIEVAAPLQEASEI